ncbi:unnamed protein product [Caenorhabditis angaria]|uniref:Uncharacterized protein n=1 Tax=Caenorhabditis angaria TaxID=860376 RepID=A0A9P1IKR9_9PELO|nr:unnamed protein product [Caenorhabditis angaria]
MLSTLGFLIHGNEKPKRLKDLTCLYMINKNQPIRDENDKPLSINDLKTELKNRVEILNLSNFQVIIDKVIEKLEEMDDSICYFVLVSTFYLSDSIFEESLKEMSVNQGLMNHNFEYKLYSELLENSKNIPKLPWDISKVLNPTELAKLPPEQQIFENPIIPIDNWGLISAEYRKILKTEELLISARENQSIIFFHLENAQFFAKLLEMYRGKSSDLFQINDKKHFYLGNLCRVEEWNLTMTKTILAKHLFLANLLSDTRQNLEALFNPISENPIRKAIQNFLREEFQQFSENLFEIFSENSENMNRHRKCHEIYEFARGFYHVLKDFVKILKNLNDFSPIDLNEMSFVGSRFAALESARKIWKRFNLILIQFIVKKCAEMLTSPEAELFDLLVDEGDSKLIRDPSVWQRLNPLSMEQSRCIDRNLSNRIVDLIISYRFFVNDKKNEERNELELFSITPCFESTIDEIMTSFGPENPPELEKSLELLMRKLPTTEIVEKYSRKILAKSIRFFDFLKQFFTQPHIHGKSISNLDVAKYEKYGFEREFLQAISYDFRSTFDDCRFGIAPKEPLNVYTTESVAFVYSQVFTILNMLKNAMDAIIETRRCDTFQREPRLRYSIFHMNDVVFTIRKNIMGLVEAAYVDMKKKLDLELSNKSLNSNECLNICYRSHRIFMKEIAAILMLSLNRGSTARILKMMVTSVSESSTSCISDDAVSADRHYQEFLKNLSLFLDLCRQDRLRYSLYKSLEFSEESTDFGRKSAFSSYSDDISCRSY